MPLIRYPGSKAKLANDLWKMFPDTVRLRLWSHARRVEYREPFFGAGAIGFKLLEQLDSECTVWLNDLDADLVCLWNTVLREPKSLQGLVHRFTPSVEAFFEFKERDGKSDGSDAERGFRKLALHRMSVSGFGVKSGGPIGGRSQENKQYTVGCRWTPSTIKRDIDRLHRRMSRFTNLRITNLDFAEVLSTPGENVFAYIDPPYYVKGTQLYKHGMSESCHDRLSETLRCVEYPWVLSYDDAPQVRDLYSWAAFTSLDITYTNAVTKSKRPKNSEVAIYPKAQQLVSTEAIG
jgi:DNA adenine methylase